MKRVIEKLTNHLGIPGDATEDVILEKMQGLPGLTAVVDLQNSLTAARTELDSVKGTLKTVEGDLVNRHLAEFEGVIGDAAKPFWAEQLVVNRTGALTALTELATLRDAGGGKRKETGADEGTRKPLHNRATARPVIPGQSGVTPDADSRAVKIRNRAHEICKAEKVPFSTAFQRAEKEILNG